MSGRVVTVSEIRAAIAAAAGGPAAAGPGAPTSALLGRLFHEVYGGLTGPDRALNLVRPLEAADADRTAWAAALRPHAFRVHVGPALLAHEAELRETTREVLTLWAAVGALCDWLADLVWEQDRTARKLERVRREVFEAHEHDVSCELTDPAWTAPVRVEGRLDALLRQPATGTPCVVELKTGRTRPEADLAQAALYRLLLEDGGRRGPLAVVSFEPARRERVFDPAQLTHAETALRALVGRLAGVLPDAAPPKPAVTTVPSAPTDEAAAVAALGQRIVAVLRDLGIDLAIEPDPLLGPTFVRFFAQPGRSMRVRMLASVGPEVWVRVPLQRPPTVSRSAGRITIDVERPHRQVVSWSRDVRPQLPPPGDDGCSTFPVGVSVEGQLVWADLADPAACHLLVAGTTGSGKSEWMKALLASLLASNTHETLQIVAIDPKRVGFAWLRGSPFLRKDGLVFPDEHDVAAVLDGLVTEMDARYQRLEQGDPRAMLPRIVCVCDELADLLDSGDRKRRQALEQRLARLGQKARAAGIHLVFATQTPRKEVVRGTIRANLVARVALRVGDALESRIVLDRAGAENLLGRGDLLFRSIGDPVRLQSPYVTEDELRSLARG